jgi:site-specific recombinase XerD
MEHQNGCKQPDQSLETLVEQTMERLKQLGYCAKAIHNYRGIWNSFVRFVQQSDAAGRFTVEAVERYLTHRGLPDAGDEALRASQRHIRAAMRMLTEVALHGCFQRRRGRGRRMSLSAYWEHLLDGYEQFCRNEHRLAPRSLRVNQGNIRRFLGFLDSRGVASARDITAAILSTYVGLLTQIRPRTLARVVYLMRSFLRYLCIQGAVDGAIVEAVPKVRVYGSERLPTIWTAQDVQSLLSVVDRASPLGKRDYAILLLAARLGLRVGDIRDLTLDHLDWEHNCIHVVQAKTGVPLELPLAEEVGEAIIDYLRHGRPMTSDRHVFVRHNAPFEPFGPDNNLHSIISSYRRRAGIQMSAQSRRGLHSLRHTLASRLLEAGVPIDTIAGTLCHLAPETTRRYLRIDVNDLRRAALDPEEVLHE